MKYLSLFTGVGGFELAIDRTFERSECVGWSEIDKHAIKVVQQRFPLIENKNIGDVKNLIENPGLLTALQDFDLLVGGSPCNDLSISKANRKGLKGTKSGLFWTYVKILKTKKPKYFLLENVASMSKEDRKIISDTLGVEPVEINSDRFTPQKRRRLYWFNWDITEALPETGDRWPELIAWSKSTRYPKGKPSYIEQRDTKDGRANTLTTGVGCGNFSSKNYREVDGERFLLHPEDCELLQGFPEGWTELSSTSQRYKQIGNAVTVPVIEYILRGLK